MDSRTTTTPNFDSDPAHLGEEADSVDESDVLKNPSWFTDRNMAFQRELFEAGFIVVTKPEQTSEEGLSRVPAGKDFFNLKTREFKVYVPTRAQSDALEKTIRDKPSVKKARQLLMKLAAFPSTTSADSVEVPDSVIVYNQKRRDEVFLPILLGDNISSDSPEREFGLYVYPWTSQNVDFEFSGFSRFVTAGCLYGAGIHGRDALNQTHPLIKHDIQFFPGQKITKVNFDRDRSPYEEMLFTEIEKFFHLIDRFSKPGEPKVLFYHLPSRDYFMFGVDLKERGRMTLPALNEFCRAIYMKTTEVTEELTHQGKAHHTKTIIESPLDNLFGGLTARLKALGNTENKYAIAVLEALGRPTNEVTPPQTMEEQAKEVDSEREKNLVKHCLHLLQTNTYNQVHQKIWRDYVSANPDSIITLDDLFKAANAVMIARASYGSNPLETCSLLPLTEKQIQVSYTAFVNVHHKKKEELLAEKEKLTKEKKALAKEIKEGNVTSNKTIAEIDADLGKITAEIAKIEAVIKAHNKNYPPAFNLTMLDPLVTYSDRNDGLPFYYDHHTDQLNGYLREQKMFAAAYRNVCLFARGQTPHAIDHYSPQTSPAKKIPIIRHADTSTPTTPNGSPPTFNEQDLRNLMNAQTASASSSSNSGISSNGSTPMTATPPQSGPSSPVSTRTSSSSQGAVGDDSAITPPKGPPPTYAEAINTPSVVRRMR